MHLNHPQIMPLSPPGLWKNCLPQNIPAAKKTGDYYQSNANRLLAVSSTQPIQCILTYLSLTKHCLS